MSPRFTPSNDASSVISTSPSSISNWISCSPIARSLSDTRRNVRRRMPTSGVLDRRHSLSNTPRLMSSVMRCDAHRQGGAPEARQAARCGPAASRRQGPAPVWPARRPTCRTARRHRCAAERPSALPGRRSSAPDAQEAVADRKARLKAALAQRIVAIRVEDPGGIGGRLQRVFHRRWLVHVARRHSRPSTSSSTATSSRLVTTRSAPAARKRAASPSRATPSAVMPPAGPPRCRRARPRPRSSGRVLSAVPPRRAGKSPGPACRAANRDRRHSP